MLLTNYVFRLFCIFSFVVFASISARAADDIIIADFEGKDYGDWKVEGKAFGSAPARGTLEGQMHVSGYEGKGLVNSFLGGDDPTGKLVSREFKIERPLLSFLIGGGGHKGLEFNLVIDGKTVRTATGPNIVPGGSEQLEWADWDVAEFNGKTAHLEIIDGIGGSWGHINVDQIMQTETKRAATEKRRTFTIAKDYLLLPVKRGAAKSWVRVELDGNWTQEFDIPLALDKNIDFYANLYVGDKKGKKVTLVLEKTRFDSQGLENVVESDEMAQHETVYSEKYRPQFHFTPRTGWTNDPNGLFWYKGKWHLFFQHNPYYTEWGNMTWGHASSPDLLHWTEHPDAIHPDKLGTIFSGSGVVDHENTSGFGKGDEKPIVLMYTYSGESARHGAKTSQGIAFSSDGGKTFTKYEKNPVIPHIIGGNRDPKVIWHEPTKQWIMALYMDREDYALFASKDLKKWDMICDIKNLGCSECPDFFPLTVDGDAKNVKWLFWGGNGKYLLGSFDGKTFTPETKPLTNKYGGNDYAAMTFSDAPEGRRIQFSWMQGGVYPDMPFNQQFSVPREFSLRTTKDGVRLFVNPVKELETLRENPDEIADKTVSDGDSVLLPLDKECFDVEMTIELKSVKKLTLELVGQKIEYLADEKRIVLEGIKAPLELSEGVLKLRILVDRTSIEIFANDGAAQIAKCFVRPDNASYKGISAKAEGGDANVKLMKSWGMKSVWTHAQK